ncbi:MAG: Flp pilus assembly protein CpaB [Pseudomonadota bacterium]|nr:Flp pilus assembly protein CpaB [Pseudomonadota bacterium]
MRPMTLLIAAGLAILAGYVALQFPARPDAKSGTLASVPTVDVLVARTPIAAGTVLDESMIDRQPWPQPLVTEGFITGRESDVTGKVTRSSFVAHEPLMAARLAGRNETGFLAASLTPGLRAVTIAIDAAPGEYGYLSAGDHVDILFMHGVLGAPDAGNARAKEKPSVAEVLVPDARVLAVATRSAKDTLLSSSPGVTVEVSQPQAQKLRLAEKVGTLSLMLRAAGDAQMEVPPPALLDQLTQAEQAQGETVTVVRGANNVDSVPLGKAGGSLLERVAMASGR